MFVHYQCVLRMKVKECLILTYKYLTLNIFILNILAEKETYRII